MGTQDLHIAIELGNEDVKVNFLLIVEPLIRPGELFVKLEPNY